MGKLFIAKYEIDKEQKSYIYYDNCYGWDEFHRDTFSPETKNIELLKLEVKGRTYQERKGNARDLAITYQLNFCCLPWSYGELATLGDYFHKIGKRYGLLREFQENAIC